MEFYGVFVPTSVLICASLALLYVFGSPLLILLTFRQPALPNIVQLPPNTPFPEEVREYLFECHEELISLGFSNVGSFSLPDQMPNVKAVFALFVNRERKTSAMAALMYAKVGGDWKLGTKYVEFSTRFSDGGLVNTMNSAQVGAFPERPNSIKTQHPEITDIGVLHSAHQLLSDTHFSGRERTLRLYDQFRGDAQALIAVGLTEELEAAGGWIPASGWRRSGRIRRSHGRRQSVPCWHCLHAAILPRHDLRCVPHDLERTLAVQADRLSFNIPSRQETTPRSRLRPVGALMAKGSDDRFVYSKSTKHCDGKAPGERQDVNPPILVAVLNKPSVTQKKSMRTVRGDNGVHPTIGGRRLGPSESRVPELRPQGFDFGGLVLLRIIERLIRDVPAAAALLPAYLQLISDGVKYLQ